MSMIWVTRSELRSLIREVAVVETGTLCSECGLTESECQCEGGGVPGAPVDEGYMGFKKLKGKLSHQKGVTNPGALAASIGRKKYGKKKFQKAAVKGKKMKGMKHEGEGYCDACDRTVGPDGTCACQRETANPWAACTASTGQSSGKKRERCIRTVKARQGDR